MTVAWSMALRSRSRGGRVANRAKGLNGFVIIKERRGSFGIAWRWRDSKTWTCGSVHTREEMEDTVRRMREYIARGEDPPPLPKWDGRLRENSASAAKERSAEEIEVARAAMRAIMSGDAKRCERCGLLQPCDPCLAEIRQAMRGARRAT